MLSISMFNWKTHFLTQRTHPHRTLSFPVSFSSAKTSCVRFPYKISLYIYQQHHSTLVTENEEIVSVFSSKSPFYCINSPIEKYREGVRMKTKHFHVLCKFIKSNKMFPVENWCFLSMPFIVYLLLSLYCNYYCTHFLTTLLWIRMQNTMRNESQLEILIWEILIVILITNREERNMRWRKKTKRRSVYAFIKYRSRNIYCTYSAV